MTPYAKRLSVPERRAVAAYYAALPVPHSPSAVTPAERAEGERIALRGHWENGVPACENCHGPEGLGVGALFPRLAGQSAAYIAAQLHDWKNGTRRDPMGVYMHAVARGLSNAEIRAVAAYFAAMPQTAAQPEPTK